MNKFNRKKTLGVNAGDCQVIAGGMAANAAHFETLLLSAGMKQPEINTLCAGNGILLRMSALRGELHTRGILPLAGRPVAAAGGSAAAVDPDAPPEVAQAISEMAACLAALSGVPTPAQAARASAGPAAIEALRAELKSLNNRLDRASSKRRWQIAAEIRQIAAGTHTAAAPLRAEQLSSELAALCSLNDQASASRKATLCAELRTLRAA